MNIAPAQQYGKVQEVWSPIVLRLLAFGQVSNRGWWRRQEKQWHSKQVSTLASPLALLRLATYDCIAKHTALHTLYSSNLDVACCRLVALEVSGEELSDDPAGQLLTEDAAVRMVMSGGGTRLIVALGRGGLQSIVLGKHNGQVPTFTPVTGEFRSHASLVGLQQADRSVFAQLS